MDRFFKKVNKTENCWLWLGAIARGYGVYSVKSKPVKAHRFLWEKVNGPIPYGLVLDHLCRVRSCVNPEHLRIATQRENILCGTGKSAKNAIKTHCSKGHEFTSQNTFRPPGRPNTRQCKVCSRESTKAWKENLRTQAVSAGP